jgi:hypothetical protein
MEVTSVAKNRNRTSLAVDTKQWSVQKAAGEHGRVFEGHVDNVLITAVNSCPWQCEDRRAGFHAATPFEFASATPASSAHPPKAVD